VRNVCPGAENSFRFPTRQRANGLVIARIDGGPMARARLMAMGLRMGDEVDVITNSGQGQLVIGVDYKRMVLGRGLARKLMVRVNPPKKIIR
jgi:Fur family ferric uptake transcriptional regulator